MPIYIQGKKIEDIISINNEELSSTKFKIMIKSIFLNPKELEKDYAVTLRDIGFEYSHFERIDDWVKFLASM